MKMIIDKTTFVKSWSLAERSAGTGTMNIFSTVRVKADADEVEMQATDIKTSIICRAQGVTVVEPGEAVIPIKGVSDLFKKAGSPEFTLQIEDGKAVMISGKSRYRFTTYPVTDFPKLPSSEGCRRFCSVEAGKLNATIDRGGLCATPGDEYPQYLSSAYFEMKAGVLAIVSTDKRRLALATCDVADEEIVGEADADAEAGVDPLLLPMKGLKELQRILGMIDGKSVVTVRYDDSQAYFTTEGMEFAVRRVESKFPPYTNILPKSHRTEADFDSAQLISAVERVDIVVRDYSRAMIMKFESGECTLSGRAPEFGEAVENLSCEMTGDYLSIGVNTRFFSDAVKGLGNPVTRLCLNGSDGHILVRATDSDAFLCMVAPVDIGQDLVETNETSGGD